MTTYHVNLNGDTLTVKFGEQPTTNSQIVRDATARLNEMIESGELAGGRLLKITGPASLPVAFALAHAVTHRYGAIAVFDPKLQGYVVAVSHDPAYQIGDVIQ